MLLNKSLLKKYSPFPLNYDLTEVMQYVDVTEKIWIIRTIGHSQYNELQQQVKDNNLTPENATLLVEAIYPYLGFAVAYESLPTTWAHFSEVGITKGKSDNSESLTIKDLTLVQQHLRNQVEARKDFAIHWINDHIQYFPLICQCKGCECSCCQDNAKLNKPNPNKEIYGTPRKCTDLK